MVRPWTVQESLYLALLIRLSAAGFTSQLRSSLLPTRSRLGLADRSPAAPPGLRVPTALPAVTRATAAVKTPRRRMVRVVTSGPASLALAGELARPSRKSPTFPGQVDGRTTVVRWSRC
jgi:hypothetical protein